MFGFHPLSTQTFSSAIPFLDVQTTTNLVSANISSVALAATAITVGTNLAMTAAQGSVAVVLFAQTSGNELAAAINSVAPFTWAQVNDTSNETWTQVDDETGANVTWRTT